MLHPPTLDLSYSGDERSMTTMISNPGARGVYALSPIIAFFVSSRSRTTLYTHKSTLSYIHTHAHSYIHIYTQTHKHTYKRESQRRKTRGYIEELVSANHAPISRRARHFPGSRLGMIFRRFVYVSAAIRFLQFVCSSTDGRIYTYVCVYVSTISRVEPQMTPTMKNIIILAAISFTLIAWTWGKWIITNMLIFTRLPVHAESAIGTYCVDYSRDMMWMCISWVLSGVSFVFSLFVNIRFFNSEIFITGF